MAERPTERDIVDRHLRRAWQAVEPAPGLREQVRARLTSSGAATMGALALGMGSKARPESAWASLRATGKLGGLVGAGLLALGSIAGYWVRGSQEPASAPAAPQLQSGEVSSRTPPSPRAEPANAPERIEAVRAPSESPEAPRAEPASAERVAVARRSARPPASEAAGASRGVDGPGAEAARQSDELALLRRAERAVRGGNAALALALIGEVEARHPRSTLLEERRAIELLAHCAVNATDARARAERFLRDHPSSVYAGRVRETCPTGNNFRR